MTNGSPVLRLVGSCVVVVFVVGAFTPLANVLHERFRVTAEPEPAEAIVVLGSSVGGDAVLDQSSLRRVLHGIVLYRRGLAPRLLLLGAGNRKGVVEAEVRARLASDLAIPDAVVMTEAGAHTTADEAALSARMLRPLGVDKVILVTGHYHMPRARRLFEGAGFEVVPAASDDVSGAAEGPEGRLRILRALATETAARLYNRAREWL